MQKQVLTLSNRKINMTITIVLNGENKKIETDCNIKQLLTELNMTDKRLAVEVNQEIISRSEFSSFTFKEQDKVEIVQAIGGGSHKEKFKVICFKL